MTAEVAVVVAGIVGLLITEFNKLNDTEFLFILPVFIFQLYLVNELAKPATNTYRWDDVTSIAFNNGLRIITINFKNRDKIKIFAEPDKLKEFYDKAGVHCPDKVTSKEELAPYLQQIPYMAAMYDKSLFRGLSIGMSILFVHCYFSGLNRKWRCKYGPDNLQPVS